MEWMGKHENDADDALVSVHRPPIGGLVMIHDGLSQDSRYTCCSRPFSPSPPPHFRCESSMSPLRKHDSNWEPQTRSRTSTLSADSRIMSVGLVSVLHANTTHDVNGIGSTHPTGPQYQECFVALRTSPVQCRMNRSPCVNGRRYSLSFGHNDYSTPVKLQNKSRMRANPKPQHDHPVLE